MDWTLRELRAFVTAVDEGAFTGAASALGVSQAAVSRAIASLEEKLGERVLRRVPRGCEPTPFGRDLLAAGRRVLAEAERFDEQARLHHSTLRVGYTWAALGRHTTPLLREWAHAHPDLELRLVRHSSRTAGLAEGESDVAIARNLLDDDGFEVVPVGREARLVAFAADDPQWRRRRTLRLAELAARPILIDARRGTTTPELWPEGARPSRFVESNDVDTWLDLVAAGVAIGVTAESTAEHHMRAGVAFRPIVDVAPITVSLVWRRDAPPVGVHDLVDAVRRRYELPQRLAD